MTNSDMHENEFNIGDFVLQIKKGIWYLKAKWLIIFFAALLGASIGFLYAYLKKTTYTANLSFALEDDKASEGGGLSSALGLANSLGFDLGTNAGGAFNGSNLIELMKSRRMIEEVLLDTLIVKGKNLSFAEQFIKFNHWREKWDKNNSKFSRRINFFPNADRRSFSREQDSLLGKMYNILIKNNVVIEQRDKKISIINVEVTTDDEVFSKFFAESLVKKVSDFYVDTKSKKARLNVMILERQTDSTRKELYDAISGVAIANDNTYNLNPALNIRRIPSTKRQVDVQANTAVLTELIKNLELAKVTLRKETPLVQIIDKPIFPLEKSKTGKLISVLLGSILGGVITIILILGKKWLEIILNSKYD